MTFNLLFDLDDTLLDSNIDAFLSAYFKKLAAHMEKSIPPERFINSLMRSTQLMYGSKRTDATLEQVFSDHFYPALGLPKEEMSAAIDNFYDHVFPTLETLTRPRPEAVVFVDWAFSQGWKIAIATDPLFPRKAILHRLRWAGLAPEKYPFTLISDFQTFHFAKVSVSYYPEFLARMGWTNEPVLMVGDSLERDVEPSRLAGLPVFWLSTDHAGPIESVPQGNFADLRNYLETTDLSSLKVDYSSPTALIAFLQATAAALHTFSISIARERWQLRPNPGEWSFLEIICHLRDVDNEVNFPRIEAILKEENAFIAGQQTDQWAEEREYIKQDGLTSLADFNRTRGKLIERLKVISATDWERKGRHTIFGPTSLRELVGIMVDHDRTHIQQAMAAVS